MVVVKAKSFKKNSLFKSKEFPSIPIVEKHTNEIIYRCHSIIGRTLFMFFLVALKRAGWFVFEGQMKVLNLRIRTGYVLAS